MEEILAFLIGFGLLTVFLAGLWKCFEKAGLAGWKALIPIYDVYLIVKMADLPGWLILLFFVPALNGIIALIVYFKFAKNFGGSTLFGILTGFIPLIGIPIIGFNDSKYQGDYRP